MKIINLRLHYPHCQQGVPGGTSFFGREGTPQPAMDLRLRCFQQRSDGFADFTGGLVDAGAVAAVCVQKALALPFHSDHTALVQDPAVAGENGFV